MCVILYYVVKVVVWIGLIFSVFSVAKPDSMLNLTIKTIQWKLKWFGLEGQISPAHNARTAIRLWSAALALVFAFLVYVFTYILVIGYAIK